jgi:hypothetical protein
LSINFRILKLIQADIIINVHRASFKVHVIFSHFNNSWIFSTDLRKLLQIYLIVAHPVTKELFHADTRTDGRIDRPNDAHSSSSKFLVWFQWNINFLKRFKKKTHQNFSIRVSCLVRKDRQREGRKLWIEFHNFVTTLQMRCTSTEDLRNFWPPYRQSSRHHITVCQVNMDTHAVNWKTQMLWNRERHNNKNHDKFQSFWTSLLHCLFTLLITPLPLLFWHFQFFML